MASFNVCRVGAIAFCHQLKSVPHPLTYLQETTLVDPMKMHLVGMFYSVQIPGLLLLLKKIAEPHNLGGDWLSIFYLQ